MPFLSASSEKSADSSLLSDGSDAGPFDAAAAGGDGFDGDLGADAFFE